MSAHQFRENGSHYNGGQVFFGYGYSAIGEPRLSMVRKWFRRGEMRGKTEDSFYVDGAPVPTYEAAVEALKSPPVFTSDEIAALALVGDEPADLRQIIGVDLRCSLAAKGAIEWGPPGHCRRTDAGRAALGSAEAEHSRPAPDDEVTDSHLGERWS